MNAGLILQPYPRGFAPRTPLHAPSLAAAPARSGRVARSRRSLAPWNAQRVYETVLNADDVGEFLDRACGFLECRILFRRQLDLDDLLDAAGAQLDRHADEEIVDPVLPFEEHGAGDDLLLVLEDDLDHLGGGGAGCVPRARANELRDLGAAVCRPFADGFDLLRRQPRIV